MLTKEERAAIAARVASYDGGILTWTNLYECLLDAPITGDVSIEEDSKYVIDCLIDLCDTSNMLELPLDKDGEVIKFGDTVYSKYGTESVVDGLGFYKERIAIYTHTVDDFISGTYYDRELTHKKPATIASLISDIKRVANQGQVDRKVYEELFRIAWALESLGDSDD